MTAVVLARIRRMKDEIIKSIQDLNVSRSIIMESVVLAKSHRGHRKVFPLTTISGIGVDADNKTVTLDFLHDRSPSNFPAESVRLTTNIDAVQRWLSDGTFDDKTSTALIQKEPKS